MLKTLSKSTTLMFLYDFLILSLATKFWYCTLNLPEKFELVTILLIIVTGLFTQFLKGDYKIREFNLTPWNVYRLFEGAVFTHIPAAIILYLLIGFSKTCIFIGLNLFTIYLGLFLYRLGFHIYLFNFKKIKNILILGADERAKIVADEIQAKYALKMNVVGFVQENNLQHALDGGDIPVYVQPENLASIIKDNKIDIVVIAQPTEMILDIPRGIRIYKMPEFYEMVTGKYYIDEKTITELYYQYMVNRSRIYDFLKRAFDIISALIILLVTLPVTAYIAIRVKLIDGASPFFTQTRVGKDGKTFECYKLRTMYVNNYVPKNSNDVKYAESVKSDDRIIPFCKWIRKARLDEIPQMINILKGEMSIVGPRAEWENEVNIFLKAIPYYACRMWVRTGWTGWSHINMNPVFTVDEEKERLEYDLYYIKNRNVLWEIGILVKAVFLAVGGRHK